MVDAIKHCLSNLTNFHGRDARSTFWWFVLFLVILQVVIGIASSIPMMVSAVGGAMEGVQSGMTPEEMQLAMMDQMAGGMRTQVWISLVMSFVMAALFIAALARRLQDIGKPGWLAILIVLPFLASAIHAVVIFDDIMELMREAMSSGSPEALDAIQTEAMGANWYGYLSYLAVIVAGIIPSDDGPNAYGEQPLGH